MEVTNKHKHYEYRNKTDKFSIFNEDKYFNKYRFNGQIHLFSF